MFSAGTFEKEFKTTPGKKLSVNIQTGGSIEIVGWDKNSINMIVEYRGSDFDEDILEIRERSSGLDVEVSFGRHHDDGMDFKFQVPKKFDAELQTMGGEITLSELEGSFSGQTMGGSLNLDNLKGNIELTTMGGSITLKDSDLDGSL